MNSVKIDRMDGGLNTKISRQLGRLDQSPDAKNIVYDDVGAAAVRDGAGVSFTAIPNTEVPHNAITYRPSYYNESFLVLTDDKVWAMSGAMSTFASQSSYVGHSAISGSTYVNSIQYKDKVFYNDPLMVPLKYGAEFALASGPAVVRWGAIAPASACTAASITSSTGVLTGTYRWVVVNRNTDGIMSDYSPESDDLTLTSGKAYITGIPTYASDYGVYDKYLARNTAAASGLFYIVTSISAQQTSYVDNNADSALLTYADTDVGSVPNFSVMHSFQERVFGANDKSIYPHRLYFSEVGQPEKFPSDNYLEVAQGDGYPIRALSNVGNNLLIGKNDGYGNGSVYLLYMPDSNTANWTLTRTDVDQGPLAKTVLRYGNSAVFLNTTGFRDMAESAQGVVTADALSYDIEPTVFRISQSAMDRVRGINYENKLWYSVPMGDTTQNNQILTFDYVRGRSGVTRLEGAWSVLQDGTYATNTSALDMGVYAGDLVSYPSRLNPDSTVWPIYNLSQESLDYDEACSWDSTGNVLRKETIDSYYTMMPCKGLPEHENNAKVWRYAYITFGTFVSLGWEMYVDYAEDLLSCQPYTTTVSVSRNDTYWGSGIWGSSSYGPGVTVAKVRITLVPVNSKQLQLRFRTKTTLSRFKIHGVELYYTLRAVRP